MDAFLAGVVAGYGIALPVGAIGAYLVALTARTSFRVGGAAALGVASADGLYALVAVVGGAALASAVADVAEPLRWVAVAVLVGLALRIVVTAFREYAHPHTRREAGGALTRPGPAYVVLLGATLLNPTTVVYFAALVVGAGAGSFDGGGAGAAFVVGAFLASASWQLLLAGGGAALGHVLTGPRGRLVTGLVSALIVTGLAALTAVG